MKIIKSITSKGINYSDEAGEEKFIDFEECNENWIQYRKRTEKLDDEKLANIKNNDKCIGQRDICANPIFIEFFTRPFTRFEFKESDEYPDPKEAFNCLQNEIILAGWKTLDLS
ncbi:hypothetical protein HNQ80_000190 [Anaerosolibacter carboniphilus]|uniref:Uncharacterized protein n=1 Tax=Anaerosolibacter carboniphilus TaxID=1417629 RepID=A0A841KLK1_9FIRM|nr:hypothetical protein [Anaerosolibacter carboniphilus]MBB6214121.1 hypothetical protein [Anaerosolibacter carboniphilus]